METIIARNVHEALPLGLAALRQYGEFRDSRNGPVLEMGTPVVTCYRNPTERVLFHPERDANPFFHLMESLWMLAGRNDVDWLAQFNGRMRQYSDDEKTYHGAYGYRWRKAFGFDQLATCIGLLKDNPDDRRVVLQIWDAARDLGKMSVDIPCNDLVFFKIKGGALDMTICCRSNDMIWGAYGANAVHFSILQEYVAAMAGYPVGHMYQLSDSFHAYTKILDPLPVLSAACNPYELGEVEVYPLVNDPSSFDLDLERFLGHDYQNLSYYNDFFTRAAVPMRRAWDYWKQKDKYGAAAALATCWADDWRRAGGEWLNRRKWS